MPLPNLNPFPLLFLVSQLAVDHEYISVLVPFLLIFLRLFLIRWFILPCGRHAFFEQCLHDCLSQQVCDVFTTFRILKRRLYVLFIVAFRLFRFRLHECLAIFVSGVVADTVGDDGGLVKEVGLSLEVGF